MLSSPAENALPADSKNVTLAQKAAQSPLRSPDPN
jgi:hypothetical protein